MDKITFKNINVYDGTLDMKLLKGVNVEVTDETISNIGNFEIDPKSKVIDGTDKYMVPGLINLHAHLPSSGKLSKKKLGDKSKLVKFVTGNPVGRMIGNMLVKKYALMALNSGVTTVRAVGGVGALDSMLRDKINAGKLVGPRLLVCNTAIGVKGGHMDGTVARAIDSVDEIKVRINELEEQKVDLVKLMITGGVLDGKVPGHPGALKMEPKIVKACADEAHKNGLKVLAHVEGDEGMKVAIENGVDSIEHSAEFDDKLAKQLKERNGAVVITLTPAMPFIKIDPEIVGYGEIAKINSEIIVEGMKKSFAQAKKFGILAGLGNDAGSTLVPHYGFANELIVATKELNITNAEALHIGTEVNAKIAGVDNLVGTIEVGKEADFIVLEKDPIEDLHNLKYPTKVVIRGHLINNPKQKLIEDIDRLLDKIY